MIKRYLACTPPGIIVTAFLLLCMQQLIHFGETGVARAGHHPVLTLRVPVPPPVPPTPLDPPVKRIDKPAALPESRPTIPVNDEPVRVAGTHRYSVPLPPAGGTELPEWSDSALVNIVRVMPQYPIKASADGREGYVIVQFDVQSDGSVANVSIVESSHAVFEKEAIRAALKFRYKARTVDGEPQPSRGVRTLFRFTLGTGYG